MWHLRSLLENNCCCHGPLWGYNSGHWLAQGPRGASCPPWSPGWGTEQGLLEHSVSIPPEPAALLCHCLHPGGEVTPCPA